jgi:hypothetical protein
MIGAGLGVALFLFCRGLFASRQAAEAKPA